jgi:hypothetical protein
MQVANCLRIAQGIRTASKELLKAYSDYDKYQEWLTEMDYTLDDLGFEDWVIEESGYQDDKESADKEFLMTYES